MDGKGCHSATPKGLITTRWRVMVTCFRGGLGRNSYFPSAQVILCFNYSILSMAKISNSLKLRPCYQVVSPVTFHHATQPGEPPNFRIRHFAIQQGWSANFQHRYPSKIANCCSCVAQSTTIEVKDYWCHQTGFMIFLNLCK